jgi:hypothetical protein
MHKLPPVILIVALAGAGCGGGKDDAPRAATPAKTTAPTAAPAYRLTLAASPPALRLGDSTTLRARVGGGAGGAVPVELWSYVPGRSDAARRVASTIARDGRAHFRVRPQKTLAYELRADHGRQHGTPELVGVSLPGRIRAALDGHRVRFTMRLTGPETAQPNPAARAYLYIVAPGPGRARMLSARRIRRHAPGDLRAVWMAHIAHPHARDRFYVCAREVMVNGYDLSDEQDTRCGMKTRTNGELREILAYD